MKSTLVWNLFSCLSPSLSFVSVHAVHATYFEPNAVLDFSSVWSIISEEVEEEEKQQQQQEELEEEQEKGKEKEKGKGKKGVFGMPQIQAVLSIRLTG